MDELTCDGETIFDANGVPICQRSDYDRDSWQTLRSCAVAGSDVIDRVIAVLGARAEASADLSADWVAIGNVVIRRDETPPASWRAIHLVSLMTGSEVRHVHRACLLYFRD